MVAAAITPTKNIFTKVIGSIEKVVSVSSEAFSTERIITNAKNAINKKIFTTDNPFPSLCILVWKLLIKTGSPPRISPIKVKQVGSVWFLSKYSMT